MTKVLTILTMLSIGCANIHVNRAILVASTLALACDAGQTMRAARGGWNGQTEGNPVMGERPDQALVAGYFVGAIAVNAIAWLATPERYKSIAPLAVIAVQEQAIDGNIKTGLGICGI
jgi:hypothetical protein